MNRSRTLLTATACALMTLYGASSAAATQTKNHEQIEPDNTYGTITLYDTANAHVCTLAVPETKITHDFSQPAARCQNNKAASFTLNNVSSATLIQFYEDETCTDAITSHNFFAKLKTTKQPTSWDRPMEFEELRALTAGYLIPGKNVRVDEIHSAGGAWSERISCVYIERSQPVK